MSPSTVFVVNLIAIVPIGVLGSLLHFAYDWSRHHPAVAIFAAVNESYWEHIKIAFWPVLVFFAAQFAFGGWALPGFVPAATVALYVVPVTMIAIVFAYKRVTGRNILWIDIAAFFLTVAASLVTFALLATELAASGWTVALSVPFLLALVWAFAVYTVRPPAEPDVFVDPLNLRYGLDAHPDLPASPGRPSRPGDSGQADSAGPADSAGQANSAGPAESAGPRDASGSPGLAGSAGLPVPPRSAGSSGPGAGAGAP